MSASNKTIVLKGELSFGKHKEYTASGASKPGHLMKVNSSNEALVHATGGGWARRLFAKENSIVGDPYTQAYATGDKIPCHDAWPGDMINVRLAAAALAVVIGDPLESAGDGTLRKALVSGGNVLYSGTADSSAIANTSTATAYDVSYTIPASLLQAGDLIRISGLVLITAVAGQTFTLTVKIGSTAVLVSGAPVAQANDVCYFFCEVKIRTIGASGTLVASGFSFIGTPSAAASAADIPSPFNLLSTAVNTLTTQAITVTQTLSTASTAISSLLKDLNVELVRGSGGRNAILAVVEEAVDNSAGGSEALCAATII